MRQKLKQARDLQRRQLPTGAAPIPQASRAVGTHERDGSEAYNLPESAENGLPVCRGVAAGRGLCVSSSIEALLATIVIEVAILPGKQPAACVHSCQEQ